MVRPCRVLHTTSFGLRREKVPRLRHGATESVEEKNDRVAQPMRKCSRVTRARAATQFAERLMPVEHRVGRVVTLVAIAKTSRSCYCGDEIPSERFDRSRNDPLNYVGGGLPRFSIRVKGESVVKGMSERIKWSL